MCLTWIMSLNKLATGTDRIGKRPVFESGGCDIHFRALWVIAKPTDTPKHVTLTRPGEIEEDDD
jgi:hypothetical protein